MAGICQNCRGVFTCFLSAKRRHECRCGKLKLALHQLLREAAGTVGCAYSTEHWDHAKPLAIGAPQYFLEPFYRTRLDQIRGAATEASASYPRTEHSLDFERCIHQVVDFFATHLVIVLQAAMRFDEQSTHLLQITGAAGCDEIEHALVFAQHVPGAASGNRIVDQIKLLWRCLSQGCRSHFGGGVGALGHSLCVRGLSQFVLDHGVYRDNCNAIRQSNSFALQASAVDQERGPGLPENRGVLIHDSARHPDEFIFGAPRESGQFYARKIARPSQGQSRGNFERSRRAESGSEGYFAADQDIAATSERKLARDTDNVVAPIASRPKRGYLIDRPLAALIEIHRNDAQQVPAIRCGCHVAIEVDGDGQHEPEVVIGVLADKVDAPGSSRQVGRAVIARLKCVDYELRRASHNITSPKMSIDVPQ